MKQFSLTTLVAAAAFAGLGSSLHGTPPMAPQSDDERASVITNFLDESPKMNGASVDVTVSDHVAVVSASVSTLDQAEWIASTIYATDEVYGAVQQISFRSADWGTAEIEDDARHQLNHALALEGTSLSAKVDDNGHLILSGQAGSLDQVEAAREIVSRIEGVKSISSEIVIDPLTIPSSSAIEANLYLRLLEDPLLSHLPVSFNFKDGELHIAGKIPSPELKERLVMNSMIGGVMTCNSDKLELDPSLTVRGMSEKRLFPEDSLKIAKLLIENDPRVTSETLSIALENGSLVVKGGAVSKTCADAIQENLRGLPGVFSVEHDYAVRSDDKLSQLDAPN